LSVWRYLDLAKLISLLDSKKMYFTRMDKFDDPFEGVVPNGITQMLLERAMDSGVGPGYYLACHKEMSQDFRMYTYVNCWHESAIESEAMWSLYTDKQKGIAVVSTREKLTSQLPDFVDIRNVEYIDFDASDIKIMPPCFYKRSAFEYEKELRAVITDENAESSGVHVDIEPNQLINKVVVSPLAEPWFIDVVKSVCAKYGSAFDVEKSSLSIKPRYAFEEYGNIL